MHPRRRFSTEEIQKNDVYPDINSTNFSREIANKLEFRYLKSPINLFPYQEFVRRFMSPFTPYKYLILYHSLGSGKSIAALSVAIDHYNFSKKKAYIITRGDTAENNFKSQILKYEELSNVKINQKMFTFYHYIQLSNIVKQMKDYDLQQFFSNKTIIMDEVHNLKENGDSTTLINICRGIKSSINTKFILSTATPMIDSGSELKSLMMLVNRENNDDLEYSTLLRGIISYSKIFSNKPQERYPGNNKYYKSVMKGIQCKNYIQEKEKGIIHVYLPLINLSLFCLPDGTFGKGIILKCMNEEKIEESYMNYNNEQKKIVYKHYTFKDKYKPFLRSPGLDVCSAKYKSIIDIVKNTHDKKIFIYLESVQGSGILLFNCILEEHGYSLHSGGKISTKGKRYTYCVGTDEFSPNIRDRIDAYNDPENKTGEYVQILIGSKVIGESISLMNVQQFHFVSPHWNNSSLNQAKGRVIREGSHDQLPIENRVVDVYIHVSALDSKNEISIDEYKVQKCLEKQEEIDVLERKMQKHAVDKYVYEPIDDIYSLDCRSFIALYAKSYIPIYLSDISELIPCTIESMIELLVPKKIIMREMLIEMIRIIITENVQIYPNRYLRSSFYTLYSTSDIAYPFYDFPEYISKSIDEPYRNLNIQSFRDLSLHKKIDYLEKSFINKNIEFLEKVPLLFMEYQNKYYHLLCYKTDANSYAASVYTPRIVRGKTRVYEMNTNGFRYINEDDNETDIITLFDIEYKKFIAEKSANTFYGYISIVDGKIRIKRNTELNKNDARKDQRGIALEYMQIEDLIDISQNLQLEIYNKIPKKILINNLEKYMFENDLYSFF